MGNFCLFKNGKVFQKENLVPVQVVQSWWVEVNDWEAGVCYLGKLGIECVYVVLVL